MVYKVTIAIGAIMPTQPSRPIILQCFWYDQPSLAIIYDARQPLVQQCDVCDASPKPITTTSSLTRQIPEIKLGGECACLKVISTLKSCAADPSRMSRHSLTQSKKFQISYKNQCRLCIVGYLAILAFASFSFQPQHNQFPMVWKIDQLHSDNRRLSVLAMCLKVCSRSHKCP